MAGKSLMESLDCQACHKVNEKSVGPAYKKIALRYQDEDNAVNFLSEKIIKGGSGNWGEVAMAAHPELSEQDAETIVHWILSLADENKEESLPLEGIFVPANKFDLSPEGMVVISASYADKGTDKVPSLTGTAELILLNPVLPAVGAEGSFVVSAISLYDGAIKLEGG